MFKHVYFGLVLGSTLLGAVGLVQSFHTQGLTQKIAAVTGIGGATTALTALGLGIAYNGKETDLENEFKGKLEKNSQLKDRELAGLKLQIDELKSRIKVLETEKEANLKQISELQERLNAKAEQYLKIVSEKDLKIKTLEGIVSERDTRVEDFLNESRTRTMTFFSKRYEQLDDLHKRLKNALEDDKVTLNNKELLVGRIEDIRKLKSELTDALEEIKDMEITCFNDVLAYIFKFDNKFFNAKMHWKDLRFSKVETENKSLSKSLSESMPRVVALERFRAGMDEVDEKITEKYEALLLNNNNIHTQLMDLLEQKNLIIDDLTKQVEELQKPLQAMGLSEYAKVANRVSGFYFENFGYRLDFINWVETEVGYNITYATRQNNALTNDELMVGNAKEQLAKLTGCLQGTFPEFTYDYRNCTVILCVVMRKPAKKEQAKADIDKIWVPVEKFESYVKNWERVRITAGSTGGKSPTAKNLALAIMKTRKGQGEIRLYDPQDGSKKDYWDMPKAGTTHADNVAGMEELCDLLDQRSKSKANHSFVLYIFDEIDSTIAQERENNGYYYFRDKVTYSLKQASHQNIGAIYIGQACDASTIPGMSWSDWNNAVQLHIGANAGIWIDKAKTITSEEATKLLEQYRKIQEYCDKKNEELGLDIFTDPGAYRFALAVPLTGLPKFIQLPDFDSYDYYDVMAESEELLSTNTQNLLISNIIDEVQQEVESMNVKTKIECPHCGSTKFKRNGKDKTTKTIQQYKCGDCGKGFSDTDIIN
ncbi:MAG: hypothetical protein KME46_33310 [Brasilonema angustatum HA4187-MV1]|jgi:DNA-directed RNA polymerase subunit RPC12/RpoP/cell division protein FtsL|nr:hypothetical protein [Brasilonema angustatum HA4187-MV1]